MSFSLAAIMACNMLYKSEINNLRKGVKILYSDRHQFDKQLRRISPHNRRHK